MSRCCLVLSCVLVVGCGSPGSGGSLGADCGGLSECGGDVVGTWKFVGYCGQLPLACTGVTLDVSGFSESLTFAANGTYSVSISGSAVYHYPRSCFGVDGGVGASCAAINNPPTMTCNQVGGDCACTYQSAMMTMVPMGTYSTSGAAITLTPAGGGTSVTFTYCARGGTLRYTIPALGMVSLAFRRQ